MNKQTIRIFIEVITGIVLSFGLNYILIYFGYTHIQNHNLSTYTVRILNLPIYKIITHNNKTIGIPYNNNMALVGIATSMILIIVIETITLIFEKRRSND